MATTRNYTDEARLCGHCGTNAVMQILGRVTDYSQAQEDYPYRDGHGYEVLKCTNCKKPEIEQFSYDEVLQDNYESPYFDRVVLYPAKPAIPLGLPAKVRKEYLDALKNRHGSPNGYGSLLGRVLESVCRDQGALGKTIGQQIDWLKKHKVNLLPPQMLTAAFHQNDFRVLAAHATAGTLTTRQVPILEHLTRAILDYVYAIPFQINLAGKALSKTSRKKKLPPPPPKTS
jgi:hypothetical protein